MAERRMAKVVSERERLGEIVVEGKRTGSRARDLPNFERMGEPRAEMIGLMRNEDLRLEGQSAESCAMDDTIAVALEGRTRGRIRFRDQASTATRGVRGIGRARGVDSKPG